jgi:exodeoxyribonuclease-5
MAGRQAKPRLPAIWFDEACFTPIRVMTSEERAEKRSFHVDFSEDQDEAYKKIKRWLADKHDMLLTLGGYAGSGKSTLASVLAGELYDKKVAFCALTGKATNVLRGKMRDAGVYSPKHTISTIHSMRYQCFTHDCSTHEPLPEGQTCPDSGKLCWSLKEAGPDEEPYDLIVVDEASMVSESILKDLLSLNVKLLAIGDHGQLPPVMGQASLMVRPNLRLEKIHRQAHGNPILELSAIIRETGQLPDYLPEGDRGDVNFVEAINYTDVMKDVFKQVKEGFSLPFGKPLASIADIATLTYTNRARVRYNEVLRAVAYNMPEKRLPQTPMIDDQVICLRNAFRTAFNGMRGVLNSAVPAKNPHFFDGVATFAEDNLKFRGSVNRHIFGRQKPIETLDDLKIHGLHVYTWDQMGFMLDYGYALTVHKAQGSQFHTASVVIERPFNVSDDNWKRWAYTAVTRASERLFLIV